MNMFCSGTIKLPQSSDARFYQQAKRFDFVIMLNDKGHFRAWPHQTHIALEHVEELWQFIQTQRTEDLPDSGEPGIAVIFWRNCVGICICPHGSEFVNDEWFPFQIKITAFSEMTVAIVASIFANAILSKQHCPWRIELDQNADQNHQWEGSSQYQRSNGDIDTSLQKRIIWSV